MSETKEEIAAERDQLRDQVDRLSAERDQLRGQLASAGVTRAPAAEHAFQLSQGALADLETFGVTNIGGVQRTTDEVRGMLTGDQSGLEIKDPSAPAATLPPARERSSIEGVDYVWPSVAPGVIDPAVAGTPGISGPPATSAK